MSRQIFDRLMALPHRQRSYPQDALIFERDDATTGLHLVLDGEVHLIRRQGDGTGVVLQRAGGGQILAEASIFSERNHCAAVAGMPSTVAIIAKAAIRAAMVKDPGLAEAFSAHLAQEIRVARLRAEILSMKRVSDRVAAWLAWHDGCLPERGKWHRIATEIGVSREALYRELATRRRGVAPSREQQH